MKILLALPASPERELFRRTLESLDIPRSDIYVAPSADSALEGVRSHSPELVVADWELPGAPGYALLRGLKKIPGGREVAVLYCLTHAQRSAASEVPDWGVLRFLERPATAEAFRERLRGLEGDIEIRRIQERSRSHPKASAAPSAGLPFFLQIPSTVMKEILDRAVHGTYPEGTTFIEAGENVEFLNLIVGGTCDVGGRTLGTGDCVGEVSFLSGQPQTRSACARTKLHVASLSRVKLAEILRRHPEVEGPLAALLAFEDLPPRSMTDSEFRSSHEAITLAEVVGLLERSRETGTLLVAHGSERGGVKLQGGEIRHAWIGGLQGPEAFHRLSGLRHPTFSFTSGPMEGPVTVRQSTLSLLMESAGREEAAPRG